MSHTSFILLLGLCLSLILSACGATPLAESSLTAAPMQAESDVSSEEETAVLHMRINETEVSVDWEDNESTAALRELCREEALTIGMSMYGGFEQVGPIGTALPRSDVQTTTAAGDIVLYAGNQIVVFYGSNSWAYTRLGHISDPNAADLAALLGNGDVTITLYLE